MSDASASRPAAAVQLQSPALGVERRRLARRAWWAAGTLPIAGYAVGIASMIVQQYGHDMFGPALATSCMVAAAAALVGLVASWRGWRSRVGALKFERDALVIEQPERRRVVPRRDVMAGCVVPTPDREAVQLTLRNGDVVTAQVFDLRDAHALLAALGLDATQAAYTQKLGANRSLGTVALTTAAFAACPGTIATTVARAATGSGMAASTVWLALVTVFLGAITNWFAFPVVSVGADGVRLTVRGRKRFVPHARIRAVRFDAPDLVLECVDGPPVRIPAGRLTSAERDMLFARIWDAQQSAHARGGGAGGELDPTAGLALLERHGRSLAEWRAAMASLVRAPGGFRTHALTVDELTRVAEDPAAPVERRVGAALALAAAADAPRVERVRVAARACADERVRVALDDAARGEVDERELEHAISATRVAQRAERT